MAKLERTFSSSPRSSKTNVSEMVSVGGKRGTTWMTNGLQTDNYRPVDTYEGIHRYDPDFDWEPEEERKVVGKVISLLMITVRY